MGSLTTETPHSEVTATLELLGRFGVSRDDLKKLRQAGTETMEQVVHIIKNADDVTAISVVILPKLELAGTVPVGRLLHFVAREHLYLGRRLGAHDFARFFADRFDDLVEPEREAADVKVHRVTKHVAAPQIEELVAEDVRVVSLGQYLSVLNKAKHGQTFPALTGEELVVAWIRDARELPWFVEARWKEGAWLISCDPIDRPIAIRKGSYVLTL